MKFPKNKLSICVINRKKSFDVRIDKVLYLKNLILMDKDSDDNIIDENYVKSKNIKTIDQENNKNLLEEYIEKYTNKRDILVYEYSCVRDCNFLLSSIFEFSWNNVFNINGVFFYIALQSNINDVSEFYSFRSYWDEYKFGDYKSLE